MKKVLIALLIVLIVPACVFAGRGLFDLTLGVTAESTYDIAAIEAGELQEFSMDKLGFGADVEAKLAFISVDGTAIYTPAQKLVSGTVSANLAIDIIFVRVKAGLGYEYQYNFDTKAFAFGNGNGTASEFANFKDAAFDARLGVDVLLGPLTIGAHASLPTKVTISQNNWTELFPAIKDGWKEARLGVTVGYAFF